MNKVLMFIAFSLAIGLLAFGGLFMIAYDPDNPAFSNGRLVGGFLILAAIVIFITVFVLERIESKLPEPAPPATFEPEPQNDIPDGLIRCQRCNGPIARSEIKELSGGLIYKCSNCGSTITLEAQPKW